MSAAFTFRPSRPVYSEHQTFPHPIGFSHLGCEQRRQIQRQFTAAILWEAPSILISCDALVLLRLKRNRFLATLRDTLAGARRFLAATNEKPIYKKRRCALG
jgi:hypothetical protein